MSQISTRFFFTVKHYLKHIRSLVNRWRYAGSEYFCPVCETNLALFLPSGELSVRSNAKCPICGSLERHRMAWLYFNNYTDLFDAPTKSMLHIAPEACFEMRLKKNKHIDYLTADLCNPRVMITMDITDIQYPDDTFDVIYCSHVLEHVDDDQKAIRELVRVLSPDGWALIIVPITADKTFGDPTITDPQERERLFGQHDHVRRYGPDFEQRLAHEGFTVKCLVEKDVVREHDLHRFGLTVMDNPAQNNYMFFCTKTER